MIRILVILFCIQTSANLFGQGMAETTGSVTQRLNGIWYVVNSWPSTKDTLIFKRESNAPHNWGDRIEIYENGEFVDAYSAKCGNDDRIRSITGSWTLDKNEIIITTSVPIYLDRTKNKILKLTSDTLVLLRLE